MPPHVLHFSRYWLPLVAYCAAIFLVSSVPGSGLRLLLFPHADKVAHLLEYALLGGLAIRAFGPGTRGFFTAAEALTASLLFAVLYGALDEVHQSYVPGRCMDFIDLALDVTGAALAAVVYARWRGRSPRATLPA